MAAFLRLDTVLYLGSGDVVSVCDCVIYRLRTGQSVSASLRVTARKGQPDCQPSIPCNPTGQAGRPQAGRRHHPNSGPFFFFFFFFFFLKQPNKSDNEAR